MSDNEACAEATVECVAVVNGRLSRGEIFDRFLSPSPRPSPDFRSRQ
jgi:hypothetical protein